MSVALIGLGRMGRCHFEAIGSSDRLNVGAVADPSPDAREFATAHGALAFESLADLLEVRGCDAAIVATPTATHLDVLRALISAGLPVLCEKPGGRTPEEARVAGELAAQSGVPLQIGYWKRFVPSLVSLRGRIGRGELGPISLVSCFQWDERPPSAVFRSESGGPLVDMAVHEIDLTRWLLRQEFVAAAGFGSSVRWDPLVAGDPESLAVVAKLSEGTLATISVGRRHTIGDSHRVQVIGTEGAEEIPFVWPPNESMAFLEALVRQAESFADVIEGAPVAGATAADAGAALDAVALMRSAMVEP